MIEQLTSVMGELDSRFAYAAWRGIDTCASLRAHGAVDSPG